VNRIKTAKTIEEVKEIFYDVTLEECEDDLFDDEQYSDWLNEIYETVDVGVKLDPADVLRSCDPVAYRCGYSDYVNFELERITEIECADGSLYTLEEIDEDEFEDDDDDVVEGEMQIKEYTEEAESCGYNVALFNPEGQLVEDYIEADDYPGMVVKTHRYSNIAEVIAPDEYKGWSVDLFNICLADADHIKKAPGFKSKYD